MTRDDILQLRDGGESSRLQFKERITDKYAVGCEMVAMSNGRGGRIIVGINDKTGEINGLSFKEVQETSNLLSSMASENVIPSILIDTENVPMGDGAVIVVTIAKGRNKPYHDNKGIIWMKQGADKRKVFDNHELAAMMMENGSIHPDAMPIADTTVKNLDEQTVRRYVISRFSQAVKGSGLTSAELQEMPLDDLCLRITGGLRADALLQNLGLILPDGRLTLAALMLMGRFPQRWLPVFTVRCISFIGNSQGGSSFRDKSDSAADGNALHLYQYIMSFLNRNLRHVQVSPDFNSLGELEVPVSALSEIVVNAILHRSYVIDAPIRVFIFDDRVEIHSPGNLPQGVDIESIKHGLSMPRNQLLFNHGVHLLPYTGAGSGMLRVIDSDYQFLMNDDVQLHEFLVTFPRECVEDGKEYDQDEVKNVQDKMGSVQDKKECVQDEAKGVQDESKSVQDVAKGRNEKFSHRIKDILNFCSIPRTAHEILSRIGTTDHPDNKQRYITTLIEAGLLEMTIPDKPTSKNQKYRTKTK